MEPLFICGCVKRECEAVMTDKAVRRGWRWGLPPGLLLLRRTSATCFFLSKPRSGCDRQNLTVACLQCDSESETQLYTETEGMREMLWFCKLVGYQLKDVNMTNTRLQFLSLHLSEKYWSVWRKTRFKSEAYLKGNCCLSKPNWLFPLVLIVT